MPGHSKLTRLIAIGLTASAVAPASAAAMKDGAGLQARHSRPSVDRVAAAQAPRPHVVHRRGPLVARNATIAPGGGGGADGPLIAALGAALLAAGAGGLVTGRRMRVRQSVNAR
jgi:hypothetical protein